MNESIKYTILIAEDEEINYLYLETLLEDEIELNCNILHSKDGRDAVIKNDNNNVDLVLMDLKMPNMNGFEATRLIRKKCPSLPIIAQTAYSTIEDKQKAFESGCNDLITKPINHSELVMIINKYLMNQTISNDSNFDQI